MVNFKRFIFMYILLILFSRMVDGPLTKYILVATVGYAAVGCLLGDFISYMLTPKPKQGE